MITEIISDQKRYQQSEKGKAAQKRYRQSEKYKAKQKRYRQSEKGKATKRRYTQSAECKTSQKHYLQSEKGKANRKQYHSRHPEHHKAIAAVNHAIRDGKLPHPDSLQCSFCPARAKQYHHHKGYDPEHWLDVIPVCIKCHQQLPSGCCPA